MLIGIISEGLGPIVEWIKALTCEFGCIIILSSILGQSSTNSDSVEAEQTTEQC